MLHAAWEAGRRILAVYATDFSVTTKSDSTPVTTADREAEHTILRELSLNAPEIPAISEETELPPFELRSHYSAYWLIDPLDGTKEFIKRNGEFTVNIALISRNRPTLGVVCAPATGLWYCGGREIGTWRFHPNGDEEPDWSTLLQTTPQLAVRAGTPQPGKLSVITAAVSRSHLSAELGQFLERLKQEGFQVRTLERGSSLKWGLVADGTADFYLRYGRTMEWDTAAGEAVANGAGCTAYSLPDLSPIRYNKEDAANPPFFVAAPSVVGLIERVLRR